MFVVVFAPSAVAAAAKAREARGKKRREMREGWGKGKFLCVLLFVPPRSKTFSSPSLPLSRFFFFSKSAHGEGGGGATLYLHAQICGKRGNRRANLIENAKRRRQEEKAESDGYRQDLFRSFFFAR